MTVRIPSPYGNMAGAPAELMAAYLRDPRLAMAQRSLQEGSSTAPLQGGWMEGLARLGQGLWGGYQQGQVGREYEDQSKAYRETLAAALRAKTPQEREAILGGNSLTQGPALEQAIRRQEKQADRDADLQARMLAQGLRYDPATQSFDEAGNFADIMANRKTQELDTEYGAKLKYQPKFDELALAVADKEAAIRAKYERQLIGARTAAEAGLIAQRRDAEIAANRAKLQDEAAVSGGVGDLFGKGDEMNVILAYGPAVTNGTATPDQVNAYNAAAAKFQKPMQVPIPDPNNPGAMMLGIYRPELPQGFPAPGAAGGPAPTQGAGASSGVTPIPGTEKPFVPTETQAKSALFARRADQAFQILSDPKIAAALSDLGQNLANNNLPDWAAGAATSPEFKQGWAAAQEAVNALNRRDSGAAVPDSEVINAIKRYIPQPWDDEGTKAQKREAMATAIEGLKIEAGPAYKPPKAGQTTSSDFAGKVRTMSSDAIRAMDVEALSAEDAQAVLGEIQRRKQSGAW